MDSRLRGNDKKGRGNDIKKMGMVQLERGFVMLGVEGLDRHGPSDLAMTK